MPLQVVRLSSLVLSLRPAGITNHTMHHNGFAILSHQHSQPMI